MKFATQVVICLFTILISNSCFSQLENKDFIELQNGEKKYGKVELMSFILGN